MSFHHFLLLIIDFIDIDYDVVRGITMICFRFQNSHGFSVKT